MLRLLRSLFSSAPAVEESNNKLAEIIAEIPHHIAAAIVVRSPHGNVEYLNSYIEVLTGYPRREFENSDSDFLRKVIHEKDRGMYDRCIAVASSGEQFEQTVRLLHQTGIELFAEIRSVPILNQTGDVTSVMLVLLNVTGNIRYQQTIEEKNKDLADFTLMLSHDLKAPINSIKGLLPIVGAELPADKVDASEAIQLIKNCTTRLDRLINGVLEYARISESEIEMVPVDLGEVITECLETYRAQLDAAQSVPTITEIPTVRGDRLRLTQVISNLVNNSIKYRDPARALSLRIAATRSGSMIRIDITDNGTGIPATKIGEVFRPFQRAHGAHIEGAGIGLALVKRLINRLGGEVSIDSAEGQGTTISILLQSDASV